MILSSFLTTSLERLINQTIELQQKDNLQGIGTSLPYILGKKYPSAYRLSGCLYFLQLLFASTRLQINCAIITYMIMFLVKLKRRLFNLKA